MGFTFLPGTLSGCKIVPSAIYIIAFLSGNSLGCYTLSCVWATRNL